jgi:hypothetical protein
MRLPHGEHLPEDGYAMPDPDELREAYDRVRALAFPGVGRGGGVDDPVTLTCGDLRRVLTLAQGYLVLTTYGGQEQMVGKLRDVRRARRARGDD